MRNGGISSMAVCPALSPTCMLHHLLDTIEQCRPMVMMRRLVDELVPGFAAMVDDASWEVKPCCRNATLPRYNDPVVGSVQVYAGASG